MWLILTAVAAVAASVGAYASTRGDTLHLGFLALIYWGATLMWLADHVIAYIQEGGPFFDFSLQGTLIGLTVLILGLVIWSIRLLVARRSRVDQPPPGKA